MDQKLQAAQVLDLSKGTVKELQSEIQKVAFISSAVNGRPEMNEQHYTGSLNEICYWLEFYHCMP